MAAEMILTVVVSADDILKRDAAEAEVILDTTELVLSSQNIQLSL
jgi:hypothetical protein